MGGEVPDVGSNRCTGTGQAVYCRAISNGTRQIPRMSAGGFGGGNGVLRRSQVEVARCANVVDVDAQQRTGFHVAEEISTEHHAAPNFVLQSKIHLHRPWSLVVGGNHVKRLIVARGQSRADIVWIRGSQTERIVGLVNLLGVS